MMYKVFIKCYFRKLINVNYWNRSGISGSICFFDNGRIIKVIEMPTMTDGKNKKQVNGAQIYHEILEGSKNYGKDIKIVIEQVSAMPGQGVTSMFNFGQSFGILKGICSAYATFYVFC